VGKAKASGQSKPVPNSWGLGWMGVGEDVYHRKLPARVCKLYIERIQLGSRSLGILSPFAPVNKRIKSEGLRGEMWATHVSITKPVLKSISKEQGRVSWVEKRGARGGKKRPYHPNGRPLRSSRPKGTKALRGGERRKKHCPAIP